MISSLRMFVKSRKIMKTSGIFFYLLVATHFIVAQPGNPPVKHGIDVNFSVPSGLKTGAKAPEFTANDVNGHAISLSNELKNGPVVIIFYRGEWCPVCNRYLSNFQDSLSYIIDTGAKVLAVTPEMPVNANKMIKKTGATFTVIPDPTEEIMQSYDVRFNVTEAYQEKIRTALEADIATNNGKDEARLPVPATFIISQDGIIVYRQFNLDYHVRASVKDIIDHLPRD
jgi:peroxiredoxin